MISRFFFFFVLQDNEVMDNKTRTKSKKSKSKVNGILIVACSVIAFVGVLLCGYGYAAVNSDLYIEGVGMVGVSKGFVSTYMQDMTPTECSEMDTYTTGQLIDRRDGQKYWVTKMADGNCWMTQNLKLILSTNTTITAALSDVTDDWTPEYDTLPTVSVVKNNKTSTYSYDFGMYVVSSPKITMCGSTTTAHNSLSECPNQMIDVSNLTPSSDPNFYENNGSTYNDTEYDAHYLVGAYYQYNAATAGTGAAVTTANSTVPSSICPKGWKLPSASTKTTATDVGRLYDGVSTANVQPFYLVPAGRVMPDRYKLYAVGYYPNVYMLTSTISAGGTAYSYGITNALTVVPTTLPMAQAGNMSAYCMENKQLSDKLEIWIRKHIRRQR